MTTQITIIGLGQIGASIGLALKDKGVLRVGFDKDISVEKAAVTLEVIDESRRLPAAVRDADIILLCLPLSEIKETLKIISPTLKEKAIVMETAPIKSGLLESMKKLIPQGRFYIGLVPALAQEAFASSETGFSAAIPDLFKRTIMVVDAPPGTPLEVEQAALDFAKLIGARPLLADFVESDGWMTSVHLLPQLTAAALLDATVDARGWMDARKLAGRPFAGVTGGLAYYDDPASLKEAAFASRVSTIHALDVLMASLKNLRDDLDNNDADAVGKLLNEAFASREEWLDERFAADWLKEGGDQIEFPDAGAQIRQIFFGGSLIDRVKKDKKKK